jgi:hypothetical protein
LFYDHGEAYFRVPGFRFAEDPKINNSGTIGTLKEEIKNNYKLQISLKRLNFSKIGNGK